MRLYHPIKIKKPLVMIMRILSLRCYFQQSLVDPIPISSLILNKASLFLELNEGRILITIVSPENASEKTRTLSNSNVYIAMVNNGSLIDC